MHSDNLSIRRNRLKSHRILAMLAMCFLVCAVGSGCNPRELPVFKKVAQEIDEAGTRAAEEAIKKDPKLQMVNEVCSAIPLPADAKFIRKGDLDDQKITIGVYYSSRTPYQDLASAWNEYFTSAGWRLLGRDESERRKILVYENDAYEVNIQYGGMGEPTVFSFGCTLKKH